MKTGALAPMRIELDDGSTFDIGQDEGDSWLRAFHMKVRDQGMTPEDGVEFVRRNIDECWWNKTVLTGSGMEPWRHEYTDKAALCRECLYWYLRAYIMACSIESCGKKNAGGIHVVIRSRSGLKVITENGAKAVESLDEAAKTGRD